MIKCFFIICIVFCLSCSNKQEFQGNKDIEHYLNLANQDSISAPRRNFYNSAAFEIIQNNTNDSLNRRNLFKVANRYYNIQNLQKYKETTEYALSKSLEAKDTINIAKAYVYLGDYYKLKSKNDSSLQYYIKAEKIYSIIRDVNNLATVKINQADIFWNQNDYFSSESAALETLKYLRNSNDNQRKYEALILLGIISNALKNYDEALEYLQKALEVAESAPLSTVDPVATTLNNIGNVYQSKGDNILAIKNFEKALQEKNLNKNNPLLYSVLLDNLAYSKFQSHSNDSDIVELFNSSLKIKDSINFTSGIIFTKTRLAEFYYSRKNIDKAILLTKDALDIANKTGNALNKLPPLKQLSSYDVQNSKFYSEQYIKINDSVQQAERKIKDKFARIQFETDEISLQKDKLAEQNRNLLLFFVGTVMIGLLLFVIRTQRAKNRELMLKQAQQQANEEIYNLMLAQQNNIEEGRIKEKKRIAQELHDGVLSRLFGARLNLDSLNKMDGSEAVEKRNNYLTELKNIEQDIREISHDLNREKFVLINNFLAILNNLLEEQAANFETEVETNIDDNIPWDKISNTLKINIYRIVQEGLQNINKYAKASKIRVSLAIVNGQLVLEVADNGQGFAVDKKSKGIGLQNMLSRAQECDGKLEIKSRKGKGTTISISFPTENRSDPEMPQTSPQPVIA